MDLPAYRDRLLDLSSTGSNIPTFEEIGACKTCPVPLAIPSDVICPDGSTLNWKARQLF